MRWRSGSTFSDPTATSPG
jgi:two-component system response regulator ChvI